MNLSSVTYRWLRRTFSWFFSTKATLAILVITVSAASIPITNYKYQAEIGGAYNIANNIVVGDKGFSKPILGTAATGTCPNGPGANVTFGPVPGNANNQILAGDIVYDVQVNETVNTPLLSCFTVSLTIPISGSQVTKSLTIASGTSVTAGWTIDCKLDTGTTTLPTSPYSFKVVVA